MPYPPFRGDKLKIYNLAKELSNSNDLDLITIAETKQDIEYIDELNKYSQCLVSLGYMNI